MLWRTSYQPEVLRDVALPDLSVPDRCVLIGALGCDLLREQELWFRLFAEDFPGDEEVFEYFLGVPMSSIEALRPPSRLKQILISSVSWGDQIRSDRAFLAVVNDGRIALMILGQPTEEVWQQTSDLWRQLKAV